MSDRESDIEVPAPTPKRAKKQITDKQKSARAANLAKGRAARMKKIAEKKKSKAVKDKEYDLGSESSESDSEVDMDDYVLSKKKKANARQVLKRERSPIQKVEQLDTSGIKKEMEEMRDVMRAIVKQQRKKPKEKRQGGTKLVLLPPHAHGEQPQATQSPAETAVVNHLLRMLGHK